MMPHHSPAHRAVFLLAAGALAACGDAPSPAAPEDAAARVAAFAEPAAPAPTAQITVGGQRLTFWPYVASDFSTAKDPLNVLFVGEADPRMLRAALRRLDGDRTAYGLPNVPPFDCTWSEAHGETYTAWADREQWTGSAIQLQCGAYGPQRFHLRLFRQDAWTLGGAHFEVLIPGTAEHEVLSWELARQFVMVDFQRAGILGAPASLSEPFSQTPTWRAVAAPVFNGLPLALRGLIGAPLANVTADWPIPNDGRAAVLRVATAEPVVPDLVEQDFVIDYNQAVPKDRLQCSAGPLDYVFVTGPAHLRLRAGIDEQGNYFYHKLLGGQFGLVPVNPLTGLPTGAPYTGVVSERGEGILTDAFSDASSSRTRREIPATGPFRGVLREALRAGTLGQDRYFRDEDC